jgi:phosphate transport system protein
MRTTFREELDRLEAELQEEGSLVLRALRGALDAVQDRDCEMADAVIAFDDDIDRRYLSIAQRIESLLARQTPVASDLRLVLAVLHTNVHLERMADYSVSIAELAKGAARASRRDDPLLESLAECGEGVEAMIKVALDSLARRDLAGAESLVDLDQAIDDANQRFVERVTLVAGDPEFREWALPMVFIARSLERIGDHAVDVGEQTAYLLTGEFREFTDASHRHSD